MRIVNCPFIRIAAVVATIILAPSVFGAGPVIEIGTLHGKLRYDVELFEVKPNMEITIILKNTDEMQHNMIICSIGRNVTMKVAQNAWALGAEAIKRHYVPEMPEVLFHTKVVNPGQEDSMTITTPGMKGDYPYVCTIPGHAFTMKGVMRVTDNPAALKLAPQESAEDRRGRRQIYLHGKSVV